MIIHWGKVSLTVLRERMGNGEVSCGGGGWGEFGSCSIGKVVKKEAMNLDFIL